MDHLFTHMCKVLDLMERISHRKANKDKKLFKSKKLQKTKLEISTLSKRNLDVLLWPVEIFSLSSEKAKTVS